MYEILKKYLLIFTIFALINSGCSEQASNVEANLNLAEAFLEKNLLNNDVIEVEPGLQYKVLKSFEEFFTTSKVFRYYNC